MLIPFGYIVRKYSLKIDNILHIGGHLLEEFEDYKKIVEPKVGEIV